MFYNITRVVFCLVFYVVFSTLISIRSAKHNKLVNPKGIFLSILLYVILFLFPVENLFVTFSSLNSAYLYQYDEEVELTIEGIDSALVIASNSISIFPRSEHGWKLCTGRSIRTVYQILSDNIVVIVYQYKYSQGFYLVISSPRGSPLSISDSNGSYFQSTSEFHAGLNQDFYSYYTCVQSIDNQYFITVDGARFYLIKE